MNIALGIAIVLLCTMIQCAMIAGLRMVLQGIATRVTAARGFVFEASVFSAAVTMLFFGMLVQVLVWAGVFMHLGEIDDLQTAFYFSLVNFTTLGYGDIVLSEQHAVLGPMEGANGILMLGLSTSFLYSVGERLREH